MDREQIMGSTPLKKRFVKDCGLPIAIFDEPYFSERVQAIDIIYNSIEMFDRFCCQLAAYDSEQEYFEAYRFIKDSAIDCIKDSGSFNDFINENFRIESKYQKKNLYIDENNDTAFVSIDMKKANFSALGYYSCRIFNDHDTWEGFMRQFTDNQHIIDSKYIRQVILGACNPKKQIQYEKYLMTILCNWIVENIPTVNIYSLGDDEIIIEVAREYGTGCGFSLSQLKDVVNSCPKAVGNLVRVTSFQLHKIKGTNGWMKYYNDRFDNKIEFKCLEPEVVHQVIKYFYFEPITEHDLVFVHNDKLAKFLKPIENPFE